jgi:hypothetical protein
MIVILIAFVWQHLLNTSRTAVQYWWLTGLNFRDDLPDRVAASERLHDYPIKIN